MGCKNQTWITWKRKQKREKLTIPTALPLKFNYNPVCCVTCKYFAILPESDAHFAGLHSLSSPRLNRRRLTLSPPDLTGQRRDVRDGF